ncbi:ATP-dependent helicase DinG, partial [Candidatus Termititenax persephonae]
RLLLKTFAAIAALPPPVLQQMRKLLKNYPSVERDVLEMLAQEQKKVRVSGGWKNAIGEKQHFARSLYYQDKEEARSLPEHLAADYFAETGKFQDFPHYEYRPQQQEMAAEIITAFNNEQHLMLEAGTGTGKSAAYLVPALLWIKQNGGPLVVSTHTKNLQDQLIEKDIPAVLKLFPQDQFQIMILKGRQNYVCLRRFEALVQQMLLSQSKEIVKTLPLFSWLVSTEQGDLSELHSSIGRKYHYQICSEGLSCLGEACPDHARCFLQHARRQTKYADLIIGNHALVLTDLAGGGALLPKYRQIILDEAHTLEETTTDSWSKEITYSACAEEIKKLEQSSRQPALISAAEKFRAGIRQYFDELSRLGREQRASGEEKNLRIRELQQREALWRALELIRLDATKQLKKMRQLAEEYLEQAGGDTDTLPVKSSLAVLQELWQILDMVALGADNYVCWLVWQNGKP